jgi:effector-binding domain-containing protein
MAIETPNYKLVKKDGNTELREYSGYILATVYVNGSTHNKAGNKAFSVLADYIFGNNIDKPKIQMTAPVTSQQKSLSKKIPMTAPVAITNNSPNSYEVSFTMPAEYTIETIPKPVNDAVKLCEVKKHTAVAIIFSGYSSENKLKTKTKTLLEWAKTNKLTPTSDPILARYDPPWRPGFIRKNEIIIKVT